MTTTLTRDPHGPDGKLDMKKAEDGLHWAVQQFKTGKETLLDITRADLPDGTHTTTFHHKAA